MQNECEKLHKFVNNLKIFTFPFDIKEIPLNGVYIVFERDEFAHSGRRIVRVGTHTGDNQLISRINQHFINENKDRSIFRKNIGRAILNKRNDSFLEQWELDLTTQKAKAKYSESIDFNKQNSVEKEVTEYIQRNLSFVVLDIKNKEDRLSFESKIISTVSLCKECQPSKHWLGSFSPKDKIRDSGLWLVNELYKQPLSHEEILVLENFGIK